MSANYIIVWAILGKLLLSENVERLEMDLKREQSAARKYLNPLHLIAFLQPSSFALLPFLTTSRLIVSHLCETIQDMEEQSYKFEGWLGHNPDSAHGKMEWGFFDPKVWEEDDVDIRITHCGVCGSDIHTLKSGWGETHYRKCPCLASRERRFRDGRDKIVPPACCVGHEIIGTVVRTGKNVQKFEPGDRVKLRGLWQLQPHSSEICGEDPTRTVVRECSTHAVCWNYRL